MLVVVFVRAVGLAAMSDAFDKGRGQGRLLSIELYSILYPRKIENQGLHARPYEAEWEYKPLDINTL